MAIEYRFLDKVKVVRKVPGGGRIIGITEKDQVIVFQGLVGRITGKKGPDWTVQFEAPKEFEECCFANFEAANLELVERAHPEIPEPPETADVSSVTAFKAPAP